MLKTSDVDTLRRFARLSGAMYLLWWAFWWGQMWNHTWHTWVPWVTCRCAPSRRRRT